MVHSAAQQTSSFAGTPVFTHLSALPGVLRVTGAGKTFTMSGNSASYEQRGLIPRVLAALLSSLRTTPGLSSWSLSLSYLEVRTEV
jgi:hypothetical protein